MKFLQFSVERYKGYAGTAKVEVAPLTIFVGPNNAGKTALARVIPLLAGGLTSEEFGDGEPLPLESGGVYHGDAFTDLVTRRSAHGKLGLEAVLENETARLSLSTTIQNVVASTRPSERQISCWRLRYGNREVAVSRQGFSKEASYDVSISGNAETARPMSWRGILPRQPERLGNWVAEPVADLRSWASGIRYLHCQRRILRSPFATPDRLPGSLGPHGSAAPLMLAADPELTERVQTWCRNVNGTSLDVRTHGPYSDIVIEVPALNASVGPRQSGQGISNVIPVVVMALTARKTGPGVDIIEHPEAELHPSAHAEVAELLLENLVGSDRPMIVETHSELLLLRARRWIAEERLPPESVAIYWIHTKRGSGSLLQKIRIDEHGMISHWPYGAFSESYEEILAIQRAARGGG